MKENKIIAEFMGVYSEENGYDYTKIGNKGVYYHTSWGWLMPVVEKIEQHCEGMPQEMIYVSLYSDINEVYKSVLTFIKNNQHEWRQQ